MQAGIRRSYHAHEPFPDDRDHEDNESDGYHLQCFRPGGQSEDQTGYSSQSEDECQDPQNHPGYTVQKDPDPLDQRQRGDNRDQQDLRDYPQYGHIEPPAKTPDGYV